MPSQFLIRGRTQNFLATSFFFSLNKTIFSHVQMQKNVHGHGETSRTNVFHARLPALSSVGLHSRMCFFLLHSVDRAEELFNLPVFLVAF